MITKVTIENFKGISEPVEIPLRPITLLFGKNSAGKSTILQAMLYALEVIRTGNADVDKVQLGGDAINLGGFRNLVHKHETDRTIRLRFDMQLDDDGLEPFQQFRFEKNDGNIKETVEPSIDQYGKLKDAWVELSISMMDKAPAVVRYNVGLNGISVVSITNTWPGAYGEPTLLNPNWKHPLLKAFAEENEGVDTFYAEPDPSLKINNPTDEDIVWHAELDMESCIPNRRAAIVLYDDYDDNDPNFLNMLWGIFSQILVRPVEILERHLSDIRYIGPIREIPNRTHSAPLSKDESRWSNGLAAWDALYSVNEAPLQKEHFMSGSVIPRINSRDAKLITKSEQFTLQKVNEYLRDVLQLGYEICREDSVAINANHEIFDLLDNLDEAQISLFQSRYAKLREYMLNCPITKRLYLYDLNNNVEVAPSDIGVGISQVVPVVTGVIAPNPDGNLPSIMAIEQPELHIHPAVQCALGDLFIREMSENRIFLIETHSEHLILRFLRRIREKNEMLKPEQMSVIYVLAKPEILELTPLAVTDDGDFEEPWPEGFFDERDEELF